MKYALAALVVLALLIAGYVLYTRSVVNPRVAEELRSNPDGERAAKVLLLTFANGRSIPVNYLEENGRFFLGADGPWWREFTDGGAPVEFFVRGRAISGHAVTVLDDPAYVEDVFSRLRPTVPDWLPDWLNGKLVVITPVR